MNWQGIKEKERGTEVQQEVDPTFPKVGRDREPNPKKVFLIGDFPAS